MSFLARSLATFAVVVASLYMAAMGQQIPSFPGKVINVVKGTGLAHATVRIDLAGSTVTSDSGEFTFPLSGKLKVGNVATFYVLDWIIVKPCEDKNGRTYLRDPAAEPIEILVLRPGDPQLKSVRATGSIIGCSIREAVSQLAPKPRSDVERRSSLPEGYSPLGAQADRKEFASEIDLDRAALRSRLVEAAHHPSGAQSSPPLTQQPDDPADPARVEFLVKKAKELGFSVEELRSAIEAWADSVEDLYQKGLAALYHGRYAQASQYISESLTTPEGNVLIHHVQLASAEYWQGHYPAAESALRKVLIVHDDDPIILNNLGLVLYAQAEHGEAEAVFKRALAIDVEALGPDHPDVARDLNNLAGIYEDQLKYEEAEPMYERALTIDEKALGPDDPRVARDLNNLALLYYRQRKYDKAEVLYKRALIINEKSLGPNHLEVATNFNNLALLYLSTRQYFEAELVSRRALDIDENILGPDHPIVARVLDTLAAVYERQGEYSKAEPLYKRALAIREKASGPDYPNVATALDHLAGVYFRQSRYNEAESLNKRVLAIYEKALPPDAPDIATVLNNLAILSYRQDNYSEAELLNRRALAIREKALGADDAGIADVAEDLALTLHKLGRDREAKAYEDQAAEIRDKSKH
jgi:tetratricopeptide (TPR) repeat protein